MKLVFLLQRNSYFLEHDLAWFRIESQLDVERAMTVYPLVVVDEFELVEQPHQRGVARVDKDAEAPHSAVLVTLEGTDGKTLETVRQPIDDRCLASVDWLTRRFRDQWVGNDAQIEIDGMRSLCLRVFLPEVDGRGAKTLRVDVQPGDIQREYTLARGGETDVVLVDAPFDGTRRLRLRCEPEAITQSTDQRQLGFVLVDQIVEAA